MTPTVKNDAASLFTISKMAKTDPASAEMAILDFVRTNFPELEVKSVRINTSKVSLNSVNGFLKTSTQEFFFKFHTEEDEQKTLEQNEYYQGELLQKAGLPIIMPVLTSTEPGKQFLIYEKVDAPTAFEEFEKLDVEFLRTGKYDEKKKQKLLQAEENLLEEESSVYLQSLKMLSAKELVDASLHQLFSSRLNSRNGATPRLDLFYTNAEVNLPNQRISFSELAEKHWVINGIEYTESLEEIIAAAKKLLAPPTSGELPAVLGHGDDHNGNKFFLDGEFRFFDPAFAGWHPVLLSFVKATVHNTFLHPFWLYDPALLESELEISYQLADDKINVGHNWNFPDSSPVRQEILELQIQKVWQPLFFALRAKNLLPENWRDYLRKAFFCCPFLVYNLLDPQKFSPRTSLLALSKCVELGSPNNTGNYIDSFFDAL